MDFRNIDPHGWDDESEREKGEKDKRYKREISVKQSHQLDGARHGLDVTKDTTIVHKNLANHWRAVCARAFGHCPVRRLFPNS